MYSQRTKERRSYSGETLFPMFTDVGDLVEKNRRHIPDRRLNSIHLKLVDADQCASCGSVLDSLSLSCNQCGTIRWSKRRVETFASIVMTIVAFFIAIYGDESMRHIVILLLILAFMLSRDVIRIIIFRKR